MLNSISIGRYRWSRYKHTWQPLKKCNFLILSKKFQDLYTLVYKQPSKIHPLMHSLCLNLCLLNYYFIRCDLYCRATLMITDYKTKVIGFIHTYRIWIIMSFNTCFCLLVCTETHFLEIQKQISYSTLVLFSKNATFCSM